MKSQSILLLILLSVLAFSCTDNLTDVGTSIQPVSDQISLGTDTFHVNTENVFVDYMYSRQDSFLLGTYYNEKYGSTQADILAQVNCPIGFDYPPGSVPDSALVVLYYKTWAGDAYSPLDVNIYEMNKATFNYSTAYPSNLDPTVYTDKSIKLGERIFSAKDAVVKRADSTAIIFKLSDDFKNRFFNIAADTYSSESKFTNFFKGMYITANFGASTLLNISQIDLEYYYHYTYVTKSSTGADSTVTVNNVINFPANSEVRQVNRFAHPDRSVMVKERDSVNYVASPANIQTRIVIPLQRLKSRTSTIVNGRKLTLNSALLQVEATEVEDTTLSMPIVSHMMLIKESEMDNFFKNNELFDDTYAIQGDLSYSEIGTTGTYKYYYTFDIATLIATELKNDPNPTEDLKLRLVPVRLTYNTSSVVTAVKQQFLMSGVTIRSGKNEYSPMRINLVYSGF